MNKRIISLILVIVLAVSFSTTALADDVPCEHEWVVERYDENEHFYKCEKCGEEKSEAHQKTLLSYDIENHILTCEACGWTKEEPHNFTGELFGLLACEAGCIVNPNSTEESGEDEEPTNPNTYPISAKYEARGPHEVKSVKTEVEADNFTEYGVWYPTDMEEGNEKYPLIVVCNGTGSGYKEGMTNSQLYLELFDHLASWGYIVVANDDESSGSGQSASTMLELILERNETPEDVFFGKIDTDAIGLYGHSQGGAAVFNAAAKYDNSGLYRAIFAASPSNNEISESLLGFTYDPTLVSAPIFMMATPGWFDTTFVINLEQLQGLYDAVDIGVMGRLTEGDHDDAILGAKGYMTAWFNYILLGDDEASGAFLGNDAEILTNENWQDVQIKITSEEPEAPLYKIALEPVHEEVPGYTDIHENDWFRENVDWAYRYGIMVGVGNGRFDAQSPADFAMTAVTIARLVGADLQEYASEGDNWYADSMAWAIDKGLLSEDNRADTVVTRGQLACILIKVLKGVGLSVEESEETVYFRDADEMSAEEYEAFHILFDLGIFAGVGDSTMAPERPATRAELAALLHRLYKIACPNE